MQNGELAALAGVSLLNLSAEDYQNMASKDWSQSYHPNIQRYIDDPFPFSAASHAELEQRIDRIKQLSPLHQKIKFKRQ